MTEPVFDSPRKALGFALNYRLDLPRPAMAKMMADGNVRRIELADGSKVTIMAYRKSERSTQLKGWDGAATAGMVLQHLISLAEPQQWTLMAELMHPTHPCACKAPCCSGHRPNQNWSRTIHRLCDHLRDVASLSKMPGKKGLSTAPGLRLALVERFFVSSRGMSMQRLADRFEVSEGTVYFHQAPIVEFLESQQRSGWRALDEGLAEAGIVGDLSSVAI